MKRILFFSVLTLVSLTLAWQCKSGKGTANADSTRIIMAEKVNQFAPFRLTTDTSVLTAKEKQMLPLLFEAAKIMDDIFWQEAWGDKNALLDSLKDENMKKFALINYGPWERLNGNKSFVPFIGEKPLGANFYPKDMTKEEFEKWVAKDKTNAYSVVRRDSTGKLAVIPYHVFFSKEINQAAALVKQAAALAEDKGLQKYLTLRAEALLTDDYYASDLAWMDMKSNTIDFVAGPIENYEDELFGYRSSHEAFILIKDKDWSKRLLRYASLLPALQKGLPVDAKYKAEIPGSNSDLGAYDAVFYAGDCNAGSKTIAINLPNDEKVQALKGSRRLQLKNSMKAKFDNILMPISAVLTDSTQRSHVKFDAFFANTMFHEVAHGLGIKQTINGKGTVREALKDKYSGIEEEKADILGLYMIGKLKQMGELDADLKDNYTTFVAGLFRSIRFGASDAHGRANLATFNYFKEKGAFIRNVSGTYTVDYDKMGSAIESLSALILTLQGNGDYEGVAKFMQEKGVMDAQLKADLESLRQKNIPVDIVFEQGPAELGLK